MTHQDNALLIGSDRITYEVRRSPRRRTLAIEVHPDLRVVVRAPSRADARFIAARVAERGGWISRTLQRFRNKGHEPARRLHYLEGETHYYLGEPYRLQVRRGRQAGVVLAGADIRVTLRGEPTAERARRALEAWYRQQALAITDNILAERFGWFRDLGHGCPTVSIRRMTTRWGSLAARRRLTLNLALIRAPRDCLEYVVMHELCHLEHRGHGRAFHSLMDALVPDWRARKQRLEAALAR